MNRNYKVKKLRTIAIIISTIMMIFGMVIITKNNVYGISQDIPVPVLATETVTKPTVIWKSCGTPYTYRLYRSDRMNGTYTCVAKEIRGTKYTDSTAVAGKKYWYKVRATKIKNGIRIYGEASKPLQIAYVKNELVLTLKSDKTGTY